MDGLGKAKEVLLNLNESEPGESAEIRRNCIQEILNFARLVGGDRNLAGREWRGFAAAAHGAVYGVDSSNQFRLSDGN